MKHRMMWVGCILLLLPTVAWAGVPDLDLSSAVTTAPAGVSVFNMLNGQGDPMTVARSATGVIFDATITLTLVDSDGSPVVFYPAEDLWLQTSGGGLVHCPNGTAANSMTDLDGVTHWAAPLFAGGHTENETVVVLVAGAALSQPGLDIIFNSPDISGDLIVNLTDLTLFTTDYVVGPDNFRSDFFRDGALNLSDLTQFARGYFFGSSCE